LSGTTRLGVLVASDFQRRAPLSRGRALVLVAGTPDAVRT